MDGQVLFQKIMIKKFSELQAKNARFSLRSFAKRVDLSPSAVSEILRGRRNVSSEKMAQVLTKLHLNPEEIQKMTNLKKTLSTAAPSKEFRQLNSDQYFTIADGHHFAILSLIETENFRGTIDEIRNRLGIPKAAVIQAVERLDRLGLLKIGKNGITSTGEQVSSPDDVQNLALQKAHRENLDLAAQALDQQSVLERDFISLTFAMNPSDIPLVKKRIRAFLSSLNEEFESRGKKKVYKTNIQFFTLEKEIL